MFMSKRCSPYFIYKKLYDFFGPRGWWPVSGLYHPLRYKPGDEKEIFEICVGALLAQNTTWKNAERAVKNLMDEGLNSPSKLVKISEKRLAVLIRPSGYFNQKAKKLKAFAEFLILNAKDGIKRFFKGGVSELREKLLSVKGIGPETADSMLLYAGNKDVFVVDAYTVRFAARFGWLNTSVYGDVQSFFEGSLSRPFKVYNEYHALIVELAKQFCSKRSPVCNKCPVSQYCKKRV